MNTKETTMKSVITSAIVAALIAGPAGAVAATQLNGRAIVKHSIPANRLVPSAVKAFTAQKVTAPAPRALAAAVNSTLDYEQTTSAGSRSATDVTATCPAGDVAIGRRLPDQDERHRRSRELAPHRRQRLEVRSARHLVLQLKTDGTPISVYVSCEPA
jgi:hypothetical protein